MSDFHSRILIAAAFTVPLFAQPAQAGFVDWLGMGDSPSESGDTTGVQDAKSVPDPSKGPVKVDMTLAMIDGTEIKNQAICDLRKREDQSCLLEITGAANIFPKKDLGTRIPENFRFEIKRWPGADDMVSISHKGTQNYAAYPAKIDASLQDMALKGPSLPLQFSGAIYSGKGNPDAHKKYYVGQTIATVTFKTSTDDR